MKEGNTVDTKSCECEHFFNWKLDNKNFIPYYWYTVVSYIVMSSLINIYYYSWHLIPWKSETFAWYYLASVTMSG